MAVATTDPVRLPPAPRIPKLLQGVGFVAAREKSVAALAKRYGSAFTLRLPIFGETVVVSDPVLIKDLFTTNTDLIARAGVLGEMFGPGSTFSLDGTEHRERRKLLVPPFHGKRMVSYEGDRRRRGAARDRVVARGQGIRNHAVDDANHPQRDPADGVRRRGCRTRRTA